MKFKLITFILISIVFLQCDKEVEDRFDQDDFVEVNGDKVALNSFEGYTILCGDSSQGDTEFYKIDVLGFDNLDLGGFVIGPRFRLAFQPSIPIDTLWDVQYLPKGNPDTWDPIFAIVLVEIVSDDCENIELVAIEGKVETKIIGGELLIYIDEVLLIDHEKENDESCSFRFSAKVSCEI